MAIYITVSKLRATTQGYWIELYMSPDDAGPLDTPIRATRALREKKVKVLIVRRKQNGGGLLTFEKRSTNALFWELSFLACCLFSLDKCIIRRCRAIGGLELESGTTQHNNRLRGINVYSQSHYRGNLPYILLRFTGYQGVIVAKESTWKFSLSE